ncbi:MAG: ATP synthase subunit I [Deltaproteobacteria bacterium]|nr:ATP synthase subunit I [Deltaproteobacteria bacterium]
MIFDVGSFIKIFGFGLGVGGIYFSGLWWTVKRLPRVRRQGIWLINSMVVRLLFLLAAFYWIMDGKWQNLLTGLFGFMMMRLITVAILRPREALPVDRPRDRSGNPKTIQSGAIKWTS